MTNITSRYSGSYTNCVFYIPKLLSFITATSVDVKCIFSCGRLLLSHVHSWLSVQSTQALLCLGCWSLLGLVQDKDVEAVTRVADVEGDREPPLDDGWDHNNL